MAGMDDIGKMYANFGKIQESQDLQEKREAFEFIIHGTEIDEKTQTLSAQFLPQLIHHFQSDPELAEKGFTAFLQLLSSENPQIRFAALSGFAEFGKQAQQFFQQFVDVLSQLLVTQDPKERQIVQRQFIRFFEIDPLQTYAGILSFLNRTSTHGATEVERAQRAKAMIFFLDHFHVHRQKVFRPETDPDVEEKEREEKEEALISGLRALLSDPGKLSLTAPPQGMKQRAAKIYRPGHWEADGTEWRRFWVCLTGIPKFRKSLEYPEQCAEIAGARANLAALDFSAAVGGHGGGEDLLETVLQITGPWAALMTRQSRLQKHHAVVQGFMDYFQTTVLPHWQVLSAADRFRFSQCFGRTVNFFHPDTEQTSAQLFQIAFDLFRAECPEASEAKEESGGGEGRSLEVRISGVPIFQTDVGGEGKSEAGINVGGEAENEEGLAVPSLVELNALNLSVLNGILENLHTLAGRCSQATKKEVCGIWTKAGQPSDYRNLEEAERLRTLFQSKLQYLKTEIEPSLPKLRDALKEVIDASKQQKAVEEKAEQQKFSVQRNRINRFLSLGNEILQKATPLLKRNDPHFSTELAFQPLQPKKKKKGISREEQRKMEKAKLELKRKQEAVANLNAAKAKRQRRQKKPKQQSKQASASLSQNPKKRKLSEKPSIQQKQKQQPQKQKQRTPKKQKLQTQQPQQQHRNQKARGKNGIIFNGNSGDGKNRSSRNRKKSRK